MSTTAVLRSQCTITERLTLTGPSVSVVDLVFDQFNNLDTLTADSTVPVTKSFAAELALSTGAKILDLTALTDGVLATKDFTGLKVQVIKLINKTGNANDMTFAVGASNGYNLMGSDWTITLTAGQHILLFGNDATPDVGSGAKTIDVTGTGSQAFQILIVAG